jgi:hypothetical protein
VRLLVCGGRDYADWNYFWRRMAEVDALYRICTIIEGGARGADRMAKAWAVEHGRGLETFTADWDGPLGKRAGSERNYRMATQGKPNLVLAFPGGTGTRNMMGVARMLKITVWEA